MKELSGKVAFITGAASGIGLALSKASGAAGMKIMMADIDEAGLDRAVAELLAEDVDACAVSGKRYTEEFRIAAVKQLTEGGHSVGDVARRLGVTTKSLYDWKEKYGESSYQDSWQAVSRSPS